MSAAELVSMEALFTGALRDEVDNGRLHYAKVVFPSGYTGMIWRHCERVAHRSMVSKEWDRIVYIPVDGRYNYGVYNRDEGKYVGDTIVTPNCVINEDFAPQYRFMQVLRWEVTPEEVEELLQLTAALPRRGENDEFFRTLNR